jgi:HAD superfamily hydrolase (TIGR01509 family)
MLVPALAGEEWDAEHGDDARADESVLFGELMHTVTPLPGARAFLELLKARGHAVVLSSSAKAHEAEAYLDLLGARDLVDGWTTSADVERTKPAPDVIQAGREKLGNPKVSVMVGDSIYDVRAAHAAKLPTVALLTGGFGAAELEAEGAAMVFEDLTALLPAIDDSPLAA